ncbi:Short chain aldehyde dehydrogenase 1 [Linum grandiflorum]
MKGSTTITSTLHQAISKRLQDKVAIITGGASGIGAATAALFAKHGAKVIVADVNPSTVIENDDISYVHCDVTDESHVENAVDTAVSTHGRLDIMFSNAGRMETPYPTISSFDRATFDAVFGVNVYGAFLAAKHAARVMVPRKRGSILFTASVVTAGVHGQAPHVYTASKHAVVGLVKNLAVEMGPHGIRVNCISPFGVATPLAMAPTGMVQDAFKGVIDKIANLKGTSLEAEDVAEAAVYLGSDEAKYVSGMNLVVDGAYGLKCAM